MSLGNSLAMSAVTNGTRTDIQTTATGAIRLAVHLPEGGVQHFERPQVGGPKDWRATDFESPGGGCAFDEPVTTWGPALEVLVLPPRTA
ncbi:hypothetical protein ACX9I7_00675 [Streptomyces sp. L500]